jgi:O-antigen/teichoic acid export membrane protein
MARGDGAYLWRASLVVYAVAAAAALLFVSRAPSFSARGRGVPLPAGFWPVVGYTHAETMVTYVYAALAPTVVLLWVDLRSLGFLHAALRYSALLTAFPAAIMAVLSPELRRLVAEGHAPEALRQTRGAVQAAVLALAPVVLGLVVFAEPAMGFFGPEFRAQADVLRWVAPSALAAPVVLCGAGAALAVGAFRAYLVASLFYVTAASALVVAIVPTWGLLGAAAATSLGALARQIAIDTVLRREGYEPPPRSAVAWGCAVAAVAASTTLRPSWPGATLLFLALLGAFAVLGRVRREEVLRLARLGLGRS